jgi:hypothetical protein
MSLEAPSLPFCLRFLLFLTALRLTHRIRGGALVVLGKLLQRRVLLFLRVAIRIEIRNDLRLI